MHFRLNHNLLSEERSSAGGTCRRQSSTLVLNEVHSVQRSQPLQRCSVMFKRSRKIRRWNKYLFRTRAYIQAVLVQITNKKKEKKLFIFFFSRKQQENWAITEKHLQAAVTTSIHASAKWTNKNNFWNFRIQFPFFSYVVWSRKKEANSKSDNEKKIYIEYVPVNCDYRSHSEALQHMSWIYERHLCVCWKPLTVSYE